MYRIFAPAAVVVFFGFFSLLVETPAWSFDSDDLPGFTVENFTQSNVGLPLPLYWTGPSNAFYEASEEQEQLQGARNLRAHEKWLSSAMVNSILDPKLPGLSWLYGMPSRVDWRAILNSCTTLQRRVESLLDGLGFPWNQPSAVGSDDIAFQKEVVKATLVQEMIIASQYQTSPLQIPGLHLKTVSEQQSSDVFVGALISELEKVSPGVKGDADYVKLLQAVFNETRGDVNTFFDHLDCTASSGEYKFKVRKFLGWRRPAVYYCGDSLLRSIDEQCPNSMPNSQQLDFISKMWIQSQEDPVAFIRLLDGEKDKRKILGSHQRAVKQYYRSHWLNEVSQGPAGSVIRAVYDACPDDALSSGQVDIINAEYANAGGNIDSFINRIDSRRELLGRHKKAIKDYFKSQNQAATQQRASQLMSQHTLPVFDEEAVAKLMWNTNFRPCSRFYSGSKDDADAMAAHSERYQEMRFAYQLIAKQNHKIISEGGYKTRNGVVVSRHALGVAEAIRGTRKDSNPSYQAFWKGKGTGEVDPSIAFPCPQTTGVPSPMKVEAYYETTDDGILAMSQIGLGKIGFLNCANRFHKGGGYLTGANAQEEAECRTTTLFPVLAAQPYPGGDARKPYFEHNEAFYTPGVKLFREGPYQDFALRDKPVDVSVVTAVAYNRNRGMGRQYDDITEGEYVWGTYQKIEQILRLFADNNVRGVVLAGFGCGAFQNNVDLVARIFAYLLSTQFKDKFDRVCFSILDRSTVSKFVSTMKAFGL